MRARRWAHRRLVYGLGWAVCTLHRKLFAIISHVRQIKVCSDIRIHSTASFRDCRDVLKAGVGPFASSIEIQIWPWYLSSFSTGRSPLPSPLQFTEMMTFWCSFDMPPQNHPHLCSKPCLCLQMGIRLKTGQEQPGCCLWTLQSRGWCTPQEESQGMRQAQTCHHSF